MDQNSPDYQAILEHIKMKSEAGDSYASMIAYLARKEVPEAEATEIIRTVTAEQQAKKAAEAPARRKMMRRKAVIWSFAQAGIGLALFLFAFFYNMATRNTAGGVFIWVLALQWISTLVIVVGLIKALWMALRKAEDFDYMEFGEGSTFWKRAFGR